VGKQQLVTVVVVYAGSIAAGAEVGNWGQSGAVIAAPASAFPRAGVAAIKLSPRGSGLLSATEPPKPGGGCKPDRSL